MGVHSVEVGMSGAGRQVQRKALGWHFWRRVGILPPRRKCLRERHVRPLVGYARPLGHRRRITEAL